MVGCALALATCKWHTYYCFWRGFHFDRGWLVARSCALVHMMHHDGQKSEGKQPIGTWIWSFLKKNDCALLQMKHLAEWKSHERNHALKEKLVILYSRYMQKVLVTGKGYSAHSCALGCALVQVANPTEWKSNERNHWRNKLLIIGKWKRIPLTGKG